MTVYVCLYEYCLVAAWIHFGNFRPSLSKELGHNCFSSPRSKMGTCAGRDSVVISGCGFFFLGGGG